MAQEVEIGAQRALDVRVGTALDPYHKRITCQQCGKSEIRHILARYCLQCLKQRTHEQEKESRTRVVVRDPDFYKKQNPYKRDWKRARQIAKGLLSCSGCGIALERIRGRHPSTAICHDCARLVARYNNRMAVVKKRKAKVLNCNRCGVQMPSKRGRDPQRARCRACQLLSKREDNHRRYDALRAQKLAAMTVY